MATEDRYDPRNVPDDPICRHGNDAETCFTCRVAFDLEMADFEAERRATQPVDTSEPPDDLPW